MFCTVSCLVSSPYLSLFYYFLHLTINSCFYQQQGYETVSRNEYPWMVRSHLRKTMLSKQDLGGGEAVSGAP